MKSIVARAALGACILALPAGLDAGTPTPVKTYDDAELTLRELIEQAEENISEADLLIEARKQAERNAARAAEVRKAYERGSRLAESGDLVGAKAEWKRALEMARNPEMKQYIAEQSRKAEEKAEAERAERRQRVEGLNAEGTALFGKGLLDDSMAKFRESLALDPSNAQARQYVETTIPEKRNALRLQAAREDQARSGLEKGRALRKGGDLNGALARWREALQLTADTELSALLNGEIRDAEESLRRAGGLVSEGAALFGSGSLPSAEAKFREALAIDPMQVAAMEWLDVKIPARRAELERLAALEAEAKALLGKGDRLLDGGDVDGAGAAWREAAAASRDPELKAAVADRFRRVEEQAAAERAAAAARVAALVREGEALFQAGRLDEAEAKFSEVLLLDSTERTAGTYLDDTIPSRRAELERLRKEEAAVRAAIEKGNRLYAAGDLDAAQAVWREALSATRNPELKSAIALQSRRAEEQAAKERAALAARIDSLGAEGVALYEADRLDEAAAKFRGVLALDASHWSSLQYIDTNIPRRRKELERLAVVEARAAEVALRGDALLKKGDAEGAKAAYSEAAGIAEKPESKENLASRIRAIVERQEQAARERQARIAAMEKEAVVLYEADRLEDASAKFRALLALDSSNRTANTYVNTTIPARKAELERRAAVAKEAKAAYDKGVKLAAAGDLRGAVGVWNEALGLAEETELTAAVNASLTEAKGKLARARTLSEEGTVLFRSGSLDASEAKFREAMALDPMNRAAMDYLEVQLPSQRAELKRQREAEELKAKIAAMEQEGVGLFEADRLDEASAKFRELLALDSSNRTANTHLNDAIPARKAELERRAAVARNVRELSLSADLLLKKGDLKGAKAAYEEAFGIAETSEDKEALQAKIAEVNAREQREAEELRTRIAAMENEGVGLFRTDRLDEAAAKFNELLALDSSNRNANTYLNDTIPARKAELARRAETARQAKAAYDKGVKLSAAGDLRGAVVAWDEALGLAEEAELTAAVNASLTDAKGKLARAQTLSEEGTVLFRSGSLDASEGKFREAMALDPMNRAAMDYLEVQLPSQRAELKRQREAEELRAKIAAMAVDGESLFRADRLDEATAKFRELIVLDGSNRTANVYLNESIPARRSELERQAAVARRVDELGLKGDALVKSSDLKGAQAAYAEAVAIVENPERKGVLMEKIAQVTARQQREAEVLRTRMATLESEGTALFRADRLDEASARFRELLALDASSPAAATFINTTIPARQAELARRAEVARQAMAAHENGLKLSAAGDLRGAVASWNEALGLAEDSALTAAINTGLAEAKGKMTRSESLGAEGAALFGSGTLDAAEAKFREAIAIDPMNRAAMNYVEVQLPARRLELKRQREAEELRAKIAATEEEALGLFRADRLDEASAKFKELLALDDANSEAGRYLNTVIPARRTELERRAAVARQARAAYEEGSRRFAAGDLDGAIGTWEEALRIAEDADVTAAINSGLAKAREKAARIRTLQDEAVSLFGSDSLEASEAKFRELLALDGANADARAYLSARIPARRTELVRRREVASNVEAALTEGNRLYASGDVKGAIARWTGGLGIAETPAQKASLAGQVRMADDRLRKEAAARQIRVSELYAEGATLFGGDRLDEAASKFRELLTLDASHPEARAYADVKIPARKAELQRMAEAESKAKAAYDRGNRLYAAGDYEGAKAAWKEALDITEAQR